MSYVLTDLSQSFGTRNLFEIDQLVVPENTKIGLVGENGVGKSTLLSQINAKQTEFNPLATVTLMPQIKPLTTMSGGQQVQHYLDQAFADHPDILLLDEPTANLDLTHIKKLTQQLRHFYGSVIIVSHDREFLDDLTTETWALADGKLTVTPGNYSDYLEQKQAKFDQQMAQFETYQAKEKQLKQAMIKKERQAAKATKVPKKYKGTAEARNAKQHFKDQQGKLSRNMAAIKKRSTQLDQVEKPKTKAAIKFDLPNGTQAKGKTMLRVDGIDVNRGGRLLISDAKFKLKDGEKLAIVGDNQAGKTSLIETIKNTHDERVYRANDLKVGYFKQQLAQLDQTKTITELVTQTSIQTPTTNRTVLANLGFKAQDLEKPISVLSGGERVKVALAQLLVSDAEILVLDEPTNYLDLETVAALGDLLAAYPRGLILISHDRSLVKQVTTKILRVEDHHLMDPSVKPVTESKTTREARRMQLEHEKDALLSQLSLNSTPELEQKWQAVLKELKNYR